MSEIYNENNSAILLGILLNDSTKCIDNKYKLNKNDFKPLLFHKILYVACYNLSIHGVKEIDAMQIEEYLSNYPSQEQTYKDNNGTEFVDTIKELAQNKVDSIQYYWENVRKHSALRDYNDKGFDINKIWDNDKSNETNERELDGWSIIDICNYFDKEQSEIKREYVGNSSVEEKHLGEWFMDIKESFKHNPLFGVSYFSDYLNTATRGWIKGQFTVFSAPSGTGKSSIAINMAVSTSATKIYDNIQKCYIENKQCSHEGTLIIQYELDISTELTPKVVACISDVPCEHILNGQYENDEEERVNEAIQIMEESGIYIVTMPSFTTVSLETCIKDYVISHNVGYVIFDYLASSATINSEIASKNKTQTRIDSVVAQLASLLKDIAVENHIAVMSFTQCNDMWRTEDILASNVVAEAKSIANKCDVAGVFAPCRSKEYKLVNDFMLANDKLSKGFNNKQPNIRILHLYKVRFGSEQQGIKIWVDADLSTCRFRDLWATTKDNKPYKIKGTKLEIE